MEERHAKRKKNMNIEYRIHDSALTSNKVKNQYAPNTKRGTAGALGKEKKEKRKKKRGKRKARALGSKAGKLKNEGNGKQHQVEHWS